MDVESYWGLMASARAAAGESASVDDVAQRLVAALVELGPDAIRDADTVYMGLVARAYGWPLWGAAYVINGGCSDDGFDYFLGWLVGQGREVFERAVANPDSLADLAPFDDEVESEELQGAALAAAHELTGRYDTGAERVARPELGPEWDFDDEAEMRARYPRLMSIES